MSVSKTALSKLEIHLDSEKALWFIFFHQLFPRFLICLFISSGFSFHHLPSLKKNFFENPDIVELSFAWGSGAVLLFNLTCH